MITPDIKDLIDKVDSRYTLVVATAKRARQLVDGAVKQTKFNSDKAVTLAIHEIAEGKVSYTRRIDADDGDADTENDSVGIGNDVGDSYDESGLYVAPVYDTDSLIARNGGLVGASD